MRVSPLSFPHGSTPKMTDRWLSLQEIVQMLGLKPESVVRLARTQGLPLRRVTPRGAPGAMESELLAWMRKRPRVGQPVREPGAMGQRDRTARRN